MQFLSDQQLEIFNSRVELVFRWKYCCQVIAESADSPFRGFKFRINMRHPGNQAVESGYRGGWYQRFLPGPCLPVFFDQLFRCFIEPQHNPVLGHELFKELVVFPEIFERVDSWLKTEQYQLWGQGGTPGRWGLLKIKTAPSLIIKKMLPRFIIGDHDGIYTGFNNFIKFLHQGRPVAFRIKREEQ